MPRSMYLLWSNRMVRQRRSSQWHTFLLVVLNAAAVPQLHAADAAGLPAPNGIIALVRADHCPLDAIKSKVDATGKVLAKDQAATFVAEDLAAYPDNNIDMFGNPSPY